MAFNDTLFQLGMDLTRSSTTQTEDLVVHASPAEVAAHPGERKPESDEQFVGTHLIIDLFGASRLDDAAHLEQAIRSAAYVAGRDVLSVHLHRHAGGLMGFAALEGGHISVNAHSRTGYAAFDILVSGDAKAHLTVGMLKETFQASDVVLKGHQRGAETSSRGWNIEAPVQTPVRRLGRTKRVA